MDGLWEASRISVVETNNESANSLYDAPYYVYGVCIDEQLIVRRNAQGRQQYAQSGAVDISGSSNCGAVAWRQGH